MAPNSGETSVEVTEATADALGVTVIDSRIVLFIAVDDPHVPRTSAVVDVCVMLVPAATRKALLPTANPVCDDAADIKIWTLDPL